ncbi:MAG: PIN domain-containing protein [Victivallales bacterium]
MHSMKAVIDTGPLVALFDSSDKHFKASVEFIKHSEFQLYTTVPVITETLFLLDFNINAQTDFLSWIYSGAMDISELEQDDMKRISELMKKYHDLPMDFADASVVLACEKLGSANVATLDKDFEIYRCSDKSRFINIFQRGIPR